MSVLLANEKASFNDLKDVLQVTDGNLASHLRYLEKEGYISISKSFVDRRPNTVYAITEAGRTAFENHLNVLESILKQR